jgi:hypothetical protein
LHVDLRTVSVTIGMPVGGSIPPWTVASLVSTISHCAANGIRCEFVMEQSSVVQIGRDAVLDDFLKDDTQKLFWIDSDMTWEPGDFLRLLALSTIRGVVCATYPRKVEGAAQYQIDMDLAATEQDENGLLPVRGAGLGFTVIERSILEQLSATKPIVSDGLNGRSMREVFRVDTIDGRRRTEDMAFFSDIRGLGQTVWLDPTINLGHIGMREWTGRVLDAFTITETPSGAPGP